MRRLDLLLIILFASCEAQTTGVSEADSNTFEKNVILIECDLPSKKLVFSNVPNCMYPNWKTKELMFDISHLMYHFIWDTKKTWAYPMNLENLTIQVETVSLSIILVNRYWKI